MDIVSIWKAIFKPKTLYVYVIMVFRSPLKLNSTNQATHAQTV